MKRRRWRAFVAVLCLLVPSGALGLSIDQVARDLRCPSCNLPLNVSDSPAAQRMKVFIGKKIALGWDKQRIENAMVEDFGRDVLLNPPKSGFDLIAWVVPPAVVVVGLLTIVVVVRGARRPERITATDDPPLTDDERRRLDALLDDRST